MTYNGIKPSDVYFGPEARQSIENILLHWVILGFRQPKKDDMYISYKLHGVFVEKCCYKAEFGWNQPKFIIEYKQANQLEGIWE